MTYILVEQHICILDKRYLQDNPCYWNTISFHIQFFHPKDFQNIHPGKYRTVGVGLVDKPRFFRKSQVLHKRSCILVDRRRGRWFCKLRCRHNYRCFYISRLVHTLRLGIRGSLDSRCSCYILEHICRWHILGWINNLVPICRVLK